jgi:hypothetical protein
MNLKSALSNGGGYAVAAAMVLGLLIGEQAEPVDNIIPSSPATVEVTNPCPDGWDFNDSSDEHIRVISCQRGGWTVFLLPDGTFNYGWDGRSPAFETDASKVPGWR